MKSPREALQPEAAPPPPPSQRHKRASLVSIISGVLSFIIVAVVVVVIGWSFMSNKISAPGPLSADKTVDIPKGDDVAQTLEENGVIDSALLMKATLLIEKNKANVKAGEYLFKQSASLQDVIDTLVSGKQVLHALTIPEGLTSQQVADRMRDNDVLVGEIRAVPPEGSLMPDTYKFARGTTREQLIRTMQQEEQKVVTTIWSRHAADMPIRSPYELVTLASIVEKETGKPDERPHVAAVFMNRLAKNIPLQSDPTIVYGLVGGKGTLGRGILKSEVDQKTPYNTYTMVGLPPGPIANPGRAALEAAANPLHTKDLYFVADGTGGHAFAETLDQHKANVVRWRQIEKDAKDKVSPDGSGAPQPALPAAATPKNQRGDADQGGQLYGSLGLLGASAPASVPRARLSDRFAAMPLQTTDAVFGSKAVGTGQVQGAASSSDPFNELGLHADGVRPDDAPAVDATDDEASSGKSANMVTFPLSPQRQAEMRAREAAYGLPSATAALNDAAPPPVAPAPPLPGGKIRIFDASEGTSLDPLRDHSYDLNSAKSVPAIKALPPMTASTNN